MHRFTDFKNFRSAEVDLSAPLTILVGRNASGKTNLIEGVEVMGALARGIPFHDITELGRGGTVEVRGGLVSCQRFGAGAFGLRVELPEVRHERGASRVAYDLEIAADSAGIHFARESLHLDEKPLFTASPLEDDLLEVVYDDFSAGPDSGKRLSGPESVLSRYSELIVGAGAGARRRIALQAAAAVLAQSRRPYVFEPMPNEMRNYERIDPRAQLTGNGSNLSSVLFSLRSGDAERAAALPRITAAIRQISEEPFRDIGFAETPTGDVIAGFVAESDSAPGGTRLIDARLLSGGILRMLAVLSALESVPDGARVVIERFDTSLHPSRAEVLLTHVAEAASRRHLNVVLTTHDTAVMNAFDESHLECVWICYRDDTLQEFRVTRLAEVEPAAITRMRGLGNFVMSGILAKKIDSGYERKLDLFMREWLESLSAQARSD